MNNPFVTLYKKLYDNTSDVKHKVTNFSQYHRVIYRISDPIVETYILAKEKKDNICMIYVICQQRNISYSTHVNLNETDLENEYLKCFECNIPTDWKERNLCLSHSLSSIRLIIDDSYK